MDEKVAVLIGAAAVVAMGGRAVRPAAKLGMKGIVMAGDTVTGAVRGVTGLYAEVREEQRQRSPVSTETASGSGE